MLECCHFLCLPKLLSTWHWVFSSQLVIVCKTWLYLLMWVKLNSHEGQRIAVDLLSTIGLQHFIFCSTSQMCSNHIQAWFRKWQMYHSALLSPNNDPHHTPQRSCPLTVPAELIFSLGQNPIIWAPKCKVNIDHTNETWYHLAKWYTWTKWGILKFSRQIVWDWCNFSKNSPLNPKTNILNLLYSMLSTLMLIEGSLVISCISPRNSLNIKNWFLPTKTLHASASQIGK